MREIQVPLAGLGDRPPSFAYEVPSTRGTFCVHKDAPGWRVTHVPSGRYVPGLTNLPTRQLAAEGARAFYVMLLAEQIDPSTPDLSNEIASHGVAFTDAMAARLLALGDVLRDHVRTPELNG
jgi:hypothetical protein